MPDGVRKRKHSVALEKHNPDDVQQATDLQLGHSGELVAPEDYYQRRTEPDHQIEERLETFEPLVEHLESWEGLVKHIANR